MIRPSLFVLGSAWFVAAVAAQAGDGAEPRGLLHLLNGDVVAGDLVDCDEADVLCWQGNTFVDPLKFPLSGISAIHLERPTARAQDAEFAVELAGGDMLLGSLNRLSDDSLEMSSAQIGRVRIDPSQVLRLVRLSGKSIKYLGPQGLAGWTPSADDVWTEDSNHIVASKPGEILLKDCEIPRRARIEIELSWKRKPDFSVEFGCQERSNEQPLIALGELFRPQRRPKSDDERQPPQFAIEVWAGGSLVLVREEADNADLELIAPINKPGPGRIRLLLLYDQEAGQALAYSMDGQLLAKVTTPSTKNKSAVGIRLENNGGDVQLEQLVVQEWLGAAPAETDSLRPHLQLVGGEVVYGNSIFYDEAAQIFTATSESGDPAERPAAEVACVVLRSAAALGKSTLRVTMADGSRVSGTLKQVVHGVVELERTGVEQLLRLPCTQIDSLTPLASQAPPVAHQGRNGRLESGATRLHGVLIAGSADDCPLAWLAHGSDSAAALRRGASAAIIYRDPPPKVETQTNDEARLPNGALAVWMGGLRVVEDPSRVPRIRAVRSGEPAKELLWLKGGDRLTCKLKSIDEEGVHFSSTLVDATFLPHEVVKAWERSGEASRLPVDEQKRQRLLTLPRIQRPHPPRHLIQSGSGDLLRGRLLAMDDKTALMEVRLETRELAAERIARIIWLDDIDAGSATAELGAEEESAAANENPAAAGISLQAVRQDGVRLTFRPETVDEGVIRGHSESLGRCEVKVDEVDAFYMGEAIAHAARELEYYQWRLQPAPDPQFVQADGAPAAVPAARSELSGKAAPDFTLGALDGGKFNLADHRGKIVVLDFWATWCGPCLQAMPVVDEVAKKFAGKDATFFAVNMQEDRATIEDCLERLGLQLNVLLDVDGAVAEKFSVTAIPQTVVIDRAGNVAAVLIGSDRNLAETLSNVVGEALKAELSEPAP